MMAKILLIEDDPAARKTMRVCAASLGHRVVEADSETLAFAVVKTEKPDAIVLDMDMGGGWAEHIFDNLRRAMPEETPIMAVSSSRTIGEAEHLFGKGVRAYVSKPLNGSQFAAQLQSMLLDRGETDLPPEDASLHAVFRDAEERYGVLGDMAEIFDGAHPRARTYRRDAPPGPGWEPVIAEECLESFSIKPYRAFLKFDKAGLVRVPKPEEYDQEWKVVLRRAAPPVLAALDGSRCPLGTGLYAIVTAQGLDCAYLTCLLNSRLFDYYFNRVRALLPGSSFLRKVDVERMPIMLPALRVQESFKNICRQLAFSKSGSARLSGGSRLQATTLARMNRMIFDIYGLSEEDVLRLGQLHF